MARRFLCTVQAPVIKLTDVPLFPDEAINKGYVDGLIALRGLPAGGTTGQSLVKVDGTDYNVQWATVSGGASTGCLPFIKTDGTPDPITINAGLLPFFKSDGTQDDINLVAC
jgi:hypothetical protein